MSKLQNILQAAAAALTGSDDPDAMQTAMQDCTRRIDEIDHRVKLIREDGPERARVMNEGQPAELVALDDELRTLNAEEKQLLHRRAKLNEKRRAAIADEGVKAAAKLRANLAATVAAAEESRRAFDAKLAAAEKAYAQISAAKNAAKAVDHPDAGEIGVDADVAGRLGVLVHPGEHERQAEYLSELSPKAANAARQAGRTINPGSWRARSGQPLGA